VVLTSTPREETNDKPKYTVKAQVPTLAGSTDPRVVQFNNEMTELTIDEIGRFRDNARMGYATPGSNGSSYNQKFTLTSPPGNILSIKIDVNYYVEGAAHPASLTRVANYDLEAGQDLSLDQLFKSGSEYLKTLSNYCVAQLKTRDIDFQSFSAGADPTSQNYINWNITPDSLQITFEEYQVAPYAAGPQIVVVPYSELASIIAPSGPIGEYAK
jgi:hypothetical protein